MFIAILMQFIKQVQRIAA